MAWGLEGVFAELDLRISARLTRSLGRADAVAWRVTLADYLVDRPKLLDEALCHELAHLAAFRIAGRREPPHGTTWRRLVRLAGYEPAVRLPAAGPLGTRSTGERGRRWIHRCPTCQFERTASRAVTRWRCADCVAAGLDGTLTIVREEAKR